MAREHAIGIITGLILLVSILVMIGSMSALARVLRAPYPIAEIGEISAPQSDTARRREELALALTAAAETPPAPRSSPRHPRPAAA